MRKIVLTVFVAVLVAVSTIQHTPYTEAQTLTMPDQKVEYTLPYPGLLPDHPLYFLKALRDRAMDITTRDYQKKAHFYLLTSDKRLVMAVALSKKGKQKLALSTMDKGEIYFSKIPPLLVTSKKQGVSTEGEFLLKLKQSNVKHREVITNFMKEATSTELEELTKILEMNKKTGRELEKL